ncbi:hypothetical protein HHK36_026578 [Tetracentron sinense]|uniref:Uncharacterized protein n=1 Tax=Tetracentron sinense TaxID=13715 RepID=A0A835D2S3_TETSI|nr:hypothetical protein HHK36_026578 [Tetracentron sinense]
MPSPMESSESDSDLENVSDSELPPYNLRFPRPTIDGPDPDANDSDYTPSEMESSDSDTELQAITDFEVGKLGIKERHPHYKQRIVRVRKVASVQNCRYLRKSCPVVFRVNWRASRKVAKEIVDEATRRGCGCI